MTNLRRISDDPTDPDYILKDGEVLKDGRVLRVGMLTMDSGTPSFGVSFGIVDGVRHAPGPASVGSVQADATSARNAAYANHLNTLTDSWRKPPPLEVATVEVKAEPTADSRSSSFDEHSRWLANAWRSA